MAENPSVGLAVPRIAGTTKFAGLSRQERRWLAIWLVVVAALTFLMVIVGGITRLTESGLSITSWKPVTGIVPPLSEVAWQAEFARYRMIPQYRDLNAGMSLAEFKSIYFWEFSHRLLARLVGTVALIPPLLLLLRGRLRGVSAVRYLAVPVLVLLQGILGWIMVSSGLAGRDLVSQYWLTAHLLLAASLYGYAVWQAANLLSAGRDVSALPARLRVRGAIIVALVFATMMAGGFTAGLHAGLVYNTFPLMDGHLVPRGYLELTPWWRNLFDNVAAVQFDHRLLATLTFLAVLLFWATTRPLNEVRSLRPRLDFLLLMVFVQVSLGISTLLLVVPIPLAVAHQASALLLFTAAILMLHGLSGHGLSGNGVQDA